MKTLHLGIVLVVVIVLINWFLMRSGDSQRGKSTFSSLLGVQSKESLETAIAGKWEGPPGYVEFFSDGSVAMKSDSLAIPMGGRWNAIAKDRIKLTISALGMEAIKTLDDVVLTKDKLKYTVEGKDIEWSRAK